MSDIRLTCFSSLELCAPPWHLSVLLPRPRTEVNKSMTSTKLLLGIDLSTTGAKALLIDFKGNFISSATTSLTLSTPHPLWSEQHPNDWWQAKIGRASCRERVART